MDRIIRVFADGVGEIAFDGVHAVASRLDVGYPEIRRVVSDAAAPLSGRTEAITLGGGDLIFEGYFLDREGLAGSSAGSTASGAPAAQNDAARLRAALCAIAAPGREVSLAVGERRRTLFAMELTFASEAPFGTAAAEKFRLTAFSDDPYFHAGERVFFGEPAALDPLTLPAALPAATGTSWSAGELVVRTDGDETCGVVFGVTFTSASVELHIRSDRESGRMYMGRSFDAGDSIVIDTTPGKRSVRTADGESLLATVDAACPFLTAPPGTTTFRWNTYSATPANVTARITPGYIGV